MGKRLLNGLPDGLGDGFAAAKEWFLARRVIGCRGLARRSGFTLVEVIGSTVMLALIVVGVVSVSMAIDGLRTQTKNAVYLSTHNLDCMERIRQMCLDDSQEMLLYYGDDVLGSDSIETTAELVPATWDHYNVYNVTIKSKMRDYQQQLTSEYLITDIGAARYTEQINPE